MFWKFESCDNCCFITDRNFLFTKPHWSKKQCFYFHHIKNCEIATKEKISLSLKSNVANWQKTQSVFFFCRSKYYVFRRWKKLAIFAHTNIIRNDGTQISKSRNFKQMIFSHNNKFFSIFFFPFEISTK